MSTILIVDDNETGRQLLGRILTSAGYEIISTGNGEQALEIFRQQKPDLIITDLNMPVMNGFEFAEAVRAETNSAHVPIIFMSAMYRDMESKVKAMDIGGNEYLTQPIDRDELIYKVKAMLRNKNLYDELLRSREALKESEQKYRTLFNNATDSLYLIDAKTLQILDCNPKASAVTGYSATELKTMTIADLHPASEQEIVKKIFKKMSKAGSFSDISGINQISNEGGTIPIEINATTFKMGNKMYSLGIFRDITERKKAQEQLMNEKNQLLNILDAMEDGVYIVNKDYDIEYINPVFKKELGAVKGHKCYEYFHKAKKICPMCKNMDVFAGKTIRWEWSSPQNQRDYDIIDTPITNHDGSISKLSIFRDITERKIMEAKLRKAAITDNLTGLFNRRGFITICEKHLNLAKRQKRRLSLLYIDLDNFKLINDQLGHNEGDRALKDTADILQKSFRESDIVARIGGDEFGVLLTEITDGADRVISTIRENLDALNERTDRTYQLSLSIGFASYDPGMPVSIDKLMSLADKAMYENKKSRTIEDHVISKAPSFTKEKRVHERYSAGEECSARFNGSGKIRVKDISLGGICLASSRRLAPNSIYEIKLISPAWEEITSTGMVIWSSRHKSTYDTKRNSRLYETGFKFIDLNETARNALDTFISGMSG